MLKLLVFLSNTGIGGKKLNSHKTNFVVSREDIGSTLSQLLTSVSKYDDQMKEQPREAQQVCSQFKHNITTTIDAHNTLQEAISKGTQTPNMLKAYSILYSNIQFGWLADMLMATGAKEDIVAKVNATIFNSDHEEGSLSLMKNNNHITKPIDLNNLNKDIPFQTLESVTTIRNSHKETYRSGNESDDNLDHKDKDQHQHVNKTGMNVTVEKYDKEHGKDYQKNRKTDTHNFNNIKEIQNGKPPKEEFVIGKRNETRNTGRIFLN